MIPGDSADVEMIETVPMVPVDFFIERCAEGVTLTLAADDHEEDIEILVTADRARELGETLYRVACGSPADSVPRYDPPTT